MASQSSVTTSGWGRDPDLLRTILDSSAGPNPKPLLLSGGGVMTGNADTGEWATADILIGGDTIVGIGPGLLSAAEDDGMIVIDCAGAVSAPARADFLAMGAGPTLTSGSRADIVVLRLADPRGAPTTPTVARPSHLDILISGGKLLIWDGAPVGEARTDAKASVFSEPTGDHPYVGLWSDEKGFLRQNLPPDRRYDEARGDRENAYRGRYWVTGTRIDYLDDLGFWAFGEVKGDQLDHAGYRLTRTP